MYKHRHFFTRTIQAFLVKVRGDSNLQEKLKAATDSDAVVSIAKEEGFSISADDLTKALLELSDEELEGVAGGKRDLDNMTSPSLKIRFASM